MKIVRKLLPAFCAVLVCISLAFSFRTVRAQGDTSVDGNAFITYGYLQSALEDLKLELLEELSGAEGTITVQSAYTDITLEKGGTLVLGSDAEAIFRGGDAVVISLSAQDGCGITDLSAGEERFSGDLLSFSHIYYKTDSESRAYILVTGDKAAFTMKGTYEIR